MCINNLKTYTKTNSVNNFNVESKVIDEIAKKLIKIKFRKIKLGEKHTRIFFSQ